MTCPYCRSQNDLDAHRCTKCGRRTQDRIAVQMTAAVPELETVEMPAPEPERPRLRLVTEAPVKRPGHPAAHNFQANFFGPMEAGRPKVAGPSARRKQHAKADRSLQPKLEFAEPVSTQELGTASLYCDAPVAVSTHRAFAALVDSVIALSAVGLFAAVFVFAGKEIEITKETWAYYGSASVLIALFYRVLFCLMDQDTPGLQFTGLQILDFDGRVPTRRQRWYRLLGGCVGLVAAGIGLIWALVDEERLTWHDHMSKTFPTPRFS